MPAPPSTPRAREAAMMAWFALRIAAVSSSLNLLVLS